MQLLRLVFAGFLFCFFFPGLYIIFSTQYRVCLLSVKTKSEPDIKYCLCLADGTKTQLANKNGKKADSGSSSGSFFTWFIVLALLGVWTSVAVVYFDLVDYQGVLGEYTVQHTCTFGLKSSWMCSSFSVAFSFPFIHAPCWKSAVAATSLAFVFTWLYIVCNNTHAVCHIHMPSVPEGNFSPE